MLTPLDRLLWIGLSLLEALALFPDVRPSRQGRPVAARAISQVLGTFIEQEPASPWQTRDGRRDWTSDRRDGYGQSVMACSEDSRRVEDARHPDLGTDRLSAGPEVAATTQSDLDDLPAQ